MEYFAQRFLRGDAVHSATWHDIPAEGHDHDELNGHVFASAHLAAENARRRIANGDFGVVTRFRVLSTIRDEMVEGR